MKSMIKMAIAMSAILACSSYSLAAGTGSGSVHECYTFGELIAEQISVQEERLATAPDVENATAIVRLYRMKCGNLAVNVRYFFEDGRTMNSANSVQQFARIEAEVLLQSGRILLDDNHSGEGILGRGLEDSHRAKRVSVSPRHFSTVEFEL